MDKHRNVRGDQGYYGHRVDGYHYRPPVDGHHGRPRDGHHGRPRDDYYGRPRDDYYGRPRDDDYGRPRYHDHDYARYPDGYYDRPPARGYYRHPAASNEPIRVVNVGTMWSARVGTAISGVGAISFAFYLLSKGNDGAAAGVGAAGLVLLICVCCAITRDLPENRNRLNSRDDRPVGVTSLSRNVAASARDADRRRATSAREAERRRAAAGRRQGQPRVARTGTIVPEESKGLAKSLLGAADAARSDAVVPRSSRNAATAATFKGAAAAPAASANHQSVTVGAPDEFL